MDLYTCIQCGNTMESRGSCLCSKCGYKMYKAPYDRQEVMRREIVGFIKGLEKRSVERTECDYYRLVPREDKAEEPVRILKNQDDQRFPSFRKIQDYAYGVRKTEQFVKRLTTSIEQLRKHIHTPYVQMYKVDFSRAQMRMEETDMVLKPAMEALGIQIELEKVTMPEIHLQYQEDPDSMLISLADALLDEMEALSSKMGKFIKQNNIYGITERQRPEVEFEPSQTESPESELRTYLQKVRSINAKKYILDITMDGDEELEEMSATLWQGMLVIMKLPVLKKTWHFIFPDGSIVSENAFFGVASQSWGLRYKRLNGIIGSIDFLSEQGEKALFELYTKMIELDVFSLLGVNKSGLMKVGKSEEALNALIGLSSIKESIKKIKAYALMNSGEKNLNLHMCFYGNPGTGKTEVARIIAGILYENKILPTDNVVEVDRGGLVGQYVGETPQKTMRQIERAMGGILFIDEAYALVPKDGGFDYGNEAVATLIKAMEDYRGKFCVILAGYRNQMQEMLVTNPGFKSRIQFELDFPNYSRDELKRIAELMLRKRGYTMAEEAMQKALDVTDVKRKEPNFANAREVRNILDQVIMCQNLRCSGTKNREIGMVDVNRYIKDSQIQLPTAGSGMEKRILTAEEELEGLIGLASVKRMVKKIKAYAKRNRQDDGFNMHMCFYGNPGTGKTEVARILSRLLYEAGVLREAKLVETDAHGLIGRYVGETAPKTQGKIQEAMGGVLFIDEAYGLASNAGGDGFSKGYGEEAIAVLLKSMEDYRGRFCVILVGYQREMQAMIGSNPGLKSRIQFTLEFPDYTREELREIAHLFLGKKGYEMDDDAAEMLLDITEHYRCKPDFANARTVRNILDQVIMNQNLRTEDEDKPDSRIILADVEDYLMDENITLGDKPIIGFV